MPNPNTCTQDRFEHAKLHAVVLDLQLTSILRPPEYEAVQGARVRFGLFECELWSAEHKSEPRVHIGPAMPGAVPATPTALCAAPWLDPMWPTLSEEVRGPSATHSEPNDKVHQDYP